MAADFPINAPLLVNATPMSAEDKTLLAEVLRIYATARGIVRGSRDEQEAARRVVGIFQLGWRTVDEIVEMLAANDDVDQRGHVVELPGRIAAQRAVSVSSAADGQWIVDITEAGQMRSHEFRTQTQANSYAAGQRFRLDLPQE